MKNVLIISQVIPQWYVDLLTSALGEDVKIDIMTGSDVQGNVISSPKHNPASIKTRLKCWLNHYRFVTHWLHGNRNRHYDLIFAVSNPPINAALGLKAKKIFNAPFIYMNWDLYPQVVEIGIKNPLAQLVCKIWHKWNSRHYPQIDQMLTIGAVMAESLNSPLKQKINIDVIPIAVDTERLRPIPHEKNLFSIKYALVDKFVILYSGKMGLGHNIELILDASRKLFDYPDIEFVFIGEGPKYQVVENFIRKHECKNILLLPLQDEEMFPYSIACGDIGIVSQEASMARLFMPSKAYSMMACGEAILGICTENDDLYRMIVSKQCGETVTNESVETLVGKILQIKQSETLLEKYKQTSRIVAMEEYSLDVIKAKYQEIFSKILFAD